MPGFYHNNHRLDYQASLVFSTTLQTPCFIILLLLNWILVAWGQLVSIYFQMPLPFMFNLICMLYSFIYFYILNDPHSSWNMATISTLWKKSIYSPSCLRCSSGCILSALYWIIFRFYILSFPLDIYFHLDLNFFGTNDQKYAYETKHKKLWFVQIIERTKIQLHDQIETSFRKAAHFPPWGRRKHILECTFLLINTFI